MTKCLFFKLTFFSNMVLMFVQEKRWMNPRGIIRVIQHYSMLMNINLKSLLLIEPNVPNRKTQVNADKVQRSHLLYALLSSCYVCCQGAHIALEHLHLDCLSMGFLLTQTCIKHSNVCICVCVSERVQSSDVKAGIRLAYIAQSSTFAIQWPSHWGLPNGWLC